MSRLGRVFSFGGAEGRQSRMRRLAGVSIGLVYLLYPASEVLSGEVTGAPARWRIAALVSFVAAYVATVFSPDDVGSRDRRTHLLLGLSTAMAVCYPLLFGGGWLALPIFMTVAYAMALPPPGALVAIGGMAATVFAAGVVTGADGGMIVGLLMQVVTLGVLFMSIRNTRVLIDQLRQARGEAARLAAAEERLRIARDLHDLLGHSLSLIVLKSELAGRLAEQGSGRVAEEVAREVADIESVARQALVEVREAVTGYRRRCLADELDAARAALTSAGISLTVKTAGTPLPADLDELFAWAVREAVTNVVRHARATRCRIDLSHGEAGAVLAVTDDGRAGPYGEARRAGAGSGLTGLAERVEAAGGTVEAGPVGAGPGGAGFRLRVAVPRMTRTPDADRLTA